MQPGKGGSEPQQLFPWHRTDGLPGGLPGSRRQEAVSTCSILPSSTAPPGVALYSPLAWPPNTLDNCLDLCFRYCAHLPPARPEHRRQASHGTSRSCRGPVSRALPILGQELPGVQMQPSAPHPHPHRTALKYHMHTHMSQLAGWHVCTPNAP